MTDVKINLNNYYILPGYTADIVDGNLCKLLTIYLKLYYKLVI